MVLAIIVFVLVALVVILTLWQLPSANQVDDHGVRRVSSLPATLPLAGRQTDRNRCALAQATVQLHRAPVLVLNDPAA